MPSSNYADTQGNDLTAITGTEVEIPFLIDMGQRQSRIYRLTIETLGAGE